MNVLPGWGLPIAYISLCYRIVVGLGRFLDQNLKADTKKASTQYLQSGGLADASNSLIKTASEALNSVERHFSMKCITR